MTHLASFFSPDRVPHDPNAFKKPAEDKDAKIQDQNEETNEKLREVLEEE